MPDALTEELIKQREDTRDLRRQLGELAKTTGIQLKKSGTVKVFRKRWVVNQKSVAGDGLIWGNASFGIWGTGKWNPGVTGSSFVLGNSVFGLLGQAQLGPQGISDWENYEISDYPGLIGSGLTNWYAFEDVDLVSSKVDSFGSNNFAFCSDTYSVDEPISFGTGKFNSGIDFPGSVFPIDERSGTSTIPFGKVTGYRRVAQSFVCPTNGIIHLIGFKRAGATGTNANTQYMEIWSDSGGNPNAKVGSLSWSWNATNWAWWSQTVDNYNRALIVSGLTPGTTYWLVFYKDVNSDTNYPNLYYDSANDYGVLKRYDGSNWQTVTGSLRFALGYTDYVTLNSAISLTYNAFSIAWWMKTTSTDYECLFSRNTVSFSGQIEVNKTANTLRFESSSNNAFQKQTMTTGITISDGQWHHYVITSGASAFKLYTDGTMTYKTTANTDTVNQQFSYFGALQGAPSGTYGVGFSGSMDEIMFFKKELNSTEISILYAASGKVLL